MRRRLEGRQHRSTGNRIHRRSGGRGRRTPWGRGEGGGGGRLEVSSESLKGSITRMRFVQPLQSAGRLTRVRGNMHRKLRRRFSLLAAMTLLVCAASAFAASKKGEDQNVRSVQGTVTDASDNTIDGAVVQIKNTKTLQIRSFICL